METRKTYSIQQQELIIRTHRQRALNKLTAFIGWHSDQITNLAIERLMSVGVADYGDKSFHKTNTQLQQEVMEELADAIVYLSIMSAQDNGEL